MTFHVNTQTTWEKQDGEHDSINLETLRFMYQQNVGNGERRHARKKQMYKYHRSIWIAKNNVFHICGYKNSRFSAPYK